MFTRTPPSNPQALNDRLVAARAAYDAEREDVLQAADERQRTVQATIADLQAESAKLTEVKQAATFGPQS